MSPTRTEPDSVARYVPSGSDASGFQVTSLDMCIDQNGKDHHTSRYYVMTNGDGLVVRRGQPFLLKVTLNRDFDFSKDTISFIFTLSCESKPSFGKGTFVVVPLLARGSRTDAPWTAFMQSASGSVVTAAITAPASGIIGQWNLEVDTRSSSDGKESRPYSFTSNVDIYILFNAWCKDDLVYMPNEDWRKEYVEQDAGRIWRGTWNRMGACFWNYGQFEKDVLKCSLFLISKIGHVQSIHRNDPIRISRALTAAMTINNNGVIFGDWNESHFDEYENPYHWVGSTDILQQFYDFKKPIKYGQCWVFAGVLTTVCRAIGLPCRPVTTFTSGHDTKGSLTIDFVFDEEANIVPSLTEDSDWNFHVWNEVWMKRLDLLPGDYDGWNAIDSTPQEMSENMYRCGPTSVKAIQRGEVMKPYDTEFLYGEVNADIVHWMYSDPTKPLKLLDKRQNAIGKYISTKAVGSWQREDITANYKIQEGKKPQPGGILSNLTNFSLMHVSGLLFNRFTINQEFKSVTVDLQLLDDVMVGSPFKNFHVWNEVWMKRLDLLPGDYDGWNAIDSTPQEMSENMYRCGPTSVKAIQRGEVMKPYDTEFLYGEVNADIVHWMYSDPTKPLKLLDKRQNAIGKYISTKAVGSWQREDITANYKIQEGKKPQPGGILSNLTNFSLMHVSGLLFNRFTINQEFKSVTVDLQLLDDVMVGSPFNVTVLLNNLSLEDDHSVSVRIKVDSVLYTGKIHDHVCKEHHEIVVKKNSEEVIKMPVSYEDYHDKLANQLAFKITCLIKVRDTNYEHLVQEKFRLRVPDITFKVDEPLMEGKEFTGTCILKNPLQKPLTKCKFHIEGPNLQPNLRVKIDHDVEPLGTVSTKFKMTPVLPGMISLGARFYSHQLKDVHGHLEKIVLSDKKN